MQPDRARTLRFAAVGLWLVLLLAIVAFASRSGFGHGRSSAPSPAYVSWATSIFLVLFVLMIPVAVWAYSVQMREYRAQRESRNFPVRVIRGFAGIVVVLGAVFLWVHYHGRFLPEFQRSGAGGGHGLPQGRSGRAADYRPTFQWPVLWVTLILLAAAGVVAWRTRDRLLPLAPRPEPDAAQAIAATISDTIDDLEAEPDARRAVIAAYARMEAALGHHGFPRRASETAVEYLQRILTGLGSRAEPVARLTDLFEQAKFSDHRIDDTLKARAIDALREIRSDLQAAA